METKGGVYCRTCISGLRVFRDAAVEGGRWLGGVPEQREGNLAQELYRRRYRPPQTALYGAAATDILAFVAARSYGGLCASLPEVVIK